MRGGSWTPPGRPIGSTTTYVMERPQKNKLTTIPAIFTFSSAVQAYAKKDPTNRGVSGMVLFNLVYVNQRHSSCFGRRTRSQRDWSQATDLWTREPSVCLFQSPQYDVRVLASAHTPNDRSCPKGQDDETDVQSVVRVWSSYQSDRRGICDSILRGDQDPWIVSCRVLELSLL